jgi:hypothetical protein
MAKLKTALLRAQETAGFIGSNESLLWKAKDALTDAINNRSDLSTAEYVRQYDALNFLQPVQYWPELNTIGTAHYDPAVPLIEELTDE